LISVSLAASFAVSVSVFCTEMNNDNHEEAGSGEGPPREFIDCIRVVVSKLLDQRLGPAGAAAGNIGAAAGNTGATAGNTVAAGTAVGAGTHDDPVTAGATTGTTRDGCCVGCCSELV